MVVLSGLLLALGGPASGATKVVTVCASGCTYTTIRAALATAVNGETIQLAAGTYAEGGVDPSYNTNGCGGCLGIQAGVTIAGAGPGLTTITAPNPGSVVTVASGGQPVTIRGVTITGGTGDPTCPAYGYPVGGGICVFPNQTLSLVNSDVSGNGTTGTGLVGGGIYVQSGDNVTIKNSTVSNNLADQAGGIFCTGFASLTITGSTVSANSAGFAGGIFEQYFGCSMTLTTSTVSNNSATAGEGGGIVDGASATLKGDTISGNSATDLGGGIFVSSGDQAPAATATISSTTFSNNSSGNSGGAIAQFQNTGGSVTLAKSDSFTGNTPNDCYGVSGC